jgi:hypothetical protein
MKDRRVKQVFFDSEHQWEEGGHKEKVNECGYGDVFVEIFVRREQGNERG